MTLYELQEMAKTVLAEAMEYVLDASGKGLDELEEDDLNLAELADGLVPVYTSDLMELASSNWEFREVPDGEYNTIDQMIAVNVYEYLYQYMAEQFESVKADLDYQPPIDLCKTSDSRIVTGGKNTQFCPDDCLLEFRDEYIEKTGDNISIDDWLDCFEVADLAELDDADEDQIFGLEWIGYWRIDC